MLSEVAVIKLHPCLLNVYRWPLKKNPLVRLYFSLPSFLPLNQIQTVHGVVFSLAVNQQQILHHTILSGPSTMIIIRSVVLNPGGVKTVCSFLRVV